MKRVVTTTLCLMAIEPLRLIITVAALLGLRSTHPEMFDPAIAAACVRTVIAEETDLG